MAPPKPIQSINRGFDILEILNSYNGSGISDIMRYSGLPKSTVYRILENLRNAGYVTKSDKGGYWLTVRVRRLAHGFEDERWVREMVTPLLLELTKQVVYPVCLATVFGTSMVIRSNTDDISDLTLDKYPPGTPIPLFKSASGWVHLAYCEKNYREALLDICRKSDDPSLRVARNSANIERRRREVRKAGYAVQRKQDTISGKTSTLAVPVISDRTFIAALVIRYIDSAMSESEAVNRYLPILKKYARKIGSGVKSAKV